MEEQIVKQIENGPQWRVTLKEVWPLCLSYIPIGLACGILLHTSGFNTILTGLVSIFVFSGGAQFMIAQMLTTTAPILTIVLMLFFLELRYALLGSSLAGYLKGQNNRFLFFFAISMNDENYAINYLKFVTDRNWTPKDALQVEHWSLLVWTIANVVGSLIGSAVSIDLTVVNFALTALFLYMIVMQLKTRLILLISVVAGVLSAVFMMLTKSTLGLVISTLIASFLGFMIEGYVKKRWPNSHLLYKIHDPSGQPEVDKEDIDI
ncbi:branched-chain amino acid transport protein [Pediococcus damnosus]|uniref:AzlC family ABC transporter permease n=1 Tax=Pediococcus damnosus TaxID=51663 RepID=UPI00078C3853|nr:AzlC family ABC transporter permease [Pediococcus damnosus]AMV69474.1 branched-chain amino acid transport protein [Pediococcus damnosus]